MSTDWLFEPMDSLFFRGGLSFNMGESGWLESVFPPHPQTMQGVIRSIAILSHCKSPYDFTSGRCGDCADKAKCPLPKAIGSAKEGDYGDLDLYGPCLMKAGTRFHPAPLDLMREKGGDRRFYPLAPPDNAGDTVECDLGKMRLPAKPVDGGYDAPEPVEGWIREDALMRYLADMRMPDNEGEVAESAYFYLKEPRVGIGRDYATKTSRDGMLYSIVPLRFRENVRIGMRVNGLEGLPFADSFATKIGGEGKVCRVDIVQSPATDNPSLRSDDRRIKLVLLQPADFGGKWYPPGFEEDTSGGTYCRKGVIDGVNLRLVSACIGRPQRIGGWDMARKATFRKESALKPMKSYAPAGSVYFFEVEKDEDSSQLKTEGKIGMNTAIGLGHYMIGRWRNV